MKAMPSRTTERCKCHLSGSSKALGPSLVRNKEVYDLTDIAANYAKQDHIHPAEAAILRLLLPELASGRMLDLGVGGGRTTVHFAKHVREYVGADYSGAMIAECQRRFPEKSDHISFQVCDARSMDMFPAGSFDFILFSHNGIDSVSHDDRLKILKEIRRVGKPGGSFCFSSHNLNWCANFFELRRLVALDAGLTVRTAKRLVLRWCYNWRLRAVTVRDSPYVMFNDGAHSRRMLTYYVRPMAQLAQLAEDFADVRVFSQATGAEIKDRGELTSFGDPWLYYLCRIKPHS